MDVSNSGVSVGSGSSTSDTGGGGGLGVEQGSFSGQQDLSNSNDFVGAGTRQQDPSLTQCLADEPSTTDTLSRQPSALDRLAVGHTPVHESLNRSAPSSVITAVDKDTSDVPSLVGDAAAGLQGASEYVSDAVNRTGTRAAAGILTNGRAGNLPAPGYASRADLATQITRPGVTAAQANGMSPYSTKAASSQILDDAARQAGKLNGLGRAVGLGLQPAIGAFQGFQSVSESATLGDQIAGTMGGALKEVDDVAVSFVAGAGAGAAVSSSGIGVVAAPAVGMAAGIAAGRSYDGTVPDGFIDRTIDEYVTPAIASAVDDYAVPAVIATVDFIERTRVSLKSLLN